MTAGGVGGSGGTGRHAGGGEEGVGAATLPPASPPVMGTATPAPAHRDHDNNPHQW